MGEELPRLRAALADHLQHDELDRERVSAMAVRLINLGWFRAGSDRHTERSGTYGITTLRKRHVTVRGRRIRLEFLGKGRAKIKTTLVDDDLAAAMRELLGLPGGRSILETSSRRRTSAPGAGRCSQRSNSPGESRTAREPSPP